MLLSIEEGFTHVRLIGSVVSSLVMQKVDDSRYFSVGVINREMIERLKALIMGVDWLYSRSW